MKPTLDIYDPETRSLLCDGRTRDAEDGLRGVSDTDSLGALRLGVLLAELGRHEPPSGQRETEFAAAYLDRVADDPDPFIRACANAYRAFGIVQSRANIPEVMRSLDAARAAATHSEASRGHVLLMSGLVYQKRGRLTEAYEELTRARDAFKRHESRRGEAAALDAMGQVLELKGHAHRALAYFSRSLAKKAVEHDQRGIALTLGQLGRLNLRLGYFDEALECFAEDLEICGRIGDLGGERRMRCDIFRTLIEAGRLDDAERAYEDARALAGATERDDLLLAKDRARHLLRRAAHEEGPTRDATLDAAKREIERAEQRLHSGHPEAFRAMFDAVQANIALARGEIVPAIRGLERVVRSYRKREARGHHAEALYDLARAYRLHDMKANASVRAHYAHAIATRMGFLRLVQDLNAELARIDAMDDGLEWLDAAASDEGHFDQRYINRHRLAAGGQGVVEKAYDAYAGDTPVIIKRPKIDESSAMRDRDRAFRQLRQEAELTNRVARAARERGEPCVCPIRDFGRDRDGCYFFVTDYVEGQTLATRLTASGRLERGELLLLAGRLLRALQLIHEAGVIHRDLKPENILLDAEGHPIIIDFGIARLLGEKRLREIAGTLEYAAPEQLACGGLPLRGSLHPRIDLYALGVILYEAAAGELPIGEAEPNTVEGWRHAKMKARIVPLADRGLGLPGAFSDLVQALLRRKKHALRSESAAAAMEVLKTLG